MQSVKNASPVHILLVYKLSKSLSSGCFLSYRQQPEVRFFFVFTSSSHNHICIVKYHFTSRDNYFENLGEITVQACEMFTSNICLWLKNVACLSLCVV